MELRPLEPAELAALGIAGPAPSVHRMGAFDGDTLRGLFEIELSARIRQRHQGTLALHGDAAAVLPTALVAADRWLGLGRLQIDTDADDANLAGLLRAAGFAVEARHVRRVERGGELRDELSWARARPGWVPDPRRPPPAWTAKAAPAGEVVIRETRPSDGMGLARTFQDPAVAWGTLQVPTTTGGEWVEKLGRNPSDAYSLVAVAGDVVVGSAGGHPLRAPRAHVVGVGMGIARSHQGRGLGRRLFEDIIRTCLARGYRRLELEVYTDNLPAMRLYESLGFASEGVRRANAWRDGGYADSLVMGLVR